MKLPYIDWIWRARGSLALDPPRGADETFKRLEPMLDDNGSSFTIDGNMLTYKKDNPAAQDKLATFPSGTLQVVDVNGQSRLRYDLVSPALLMVFLAPFMFLAFAQVTIAVGAMEKASEGREAAAEAEKEEEEEKAEQRLHPIDIALGAPAPETLAEKKAKEEEEGEDEGPSPTPAYVFAGIFAALYIVGRLLEPWLIRRRLRRALSGTAQDDAGISATHAEWPSPS